MTKTFRELNLKSAFLFAAALEDKETCRLVLELVLDQPISKLNVHAEHSLLYNSDFRSLRLDIYAGDEMCVEYNLEMQNENEGNLAKRSRFHQAEMDVASLKPGEDFKSLQPSYVIFICTFDPFGDKLYRYTFENRCQENGRRLEDGAKKIFLSTKGTNQEEVPEALVDFLKYVEQSTEEVASASQDNRIQKLHEKIRTLKENRTWEARYMKFEELLQESESKGYEKGHKEGCKEGQDQTLELVSRMAADGRMGEIERLKKEPEFLREMLEYYKIQTI